MSRHGSQVLSNGTCHNMAFFVVTGVLVLCRYKGFLVSIKMIMTRGRGCDRALLRPGDFVSRNKFVVSRQDLMKVFYVATECGQDQGALCCDTTFCVVTKLVKAKSFYVATGYFWVATEFGLGQGFYVATKCFCVTAKFVQARSFFVAEACFYVAIELTKVEFFYVATEYVRSRHSGQMEKFCVATGNFMLRHS